MLLSLRHKVLNDKRINVHLNISFNLNLLKPDSSAKIMADVIHSALFRSIIPANIYSRVYET